MTLPRGITGSLWPAFASARLVCLAVRPAYAIALSPRCPTAVSRPSRSSVTLWEETAPVKLPARHCPPLRQEGALERQGRRGGISPVAPKRPESPLRCLPPMLRERARRPVSSCSKGSRGLSVWPRARSIFTAISISLGPGRRQRGHGYTIRAGRNLPDKEFRYLRTVIVTAAVYRGFDPGLRPKPDPIN